MTGHTILTEKQPRIRTTLPRSISSKRSRERTKRALKALSESFVNQARTDLAEIERSYQRLIDASSADQERMTLDHLFRLTLNLKGQGGTFGYPLISSISGRLCRAVDPIKSAGQWDGEKIRMYIDAISIVLTEEIHGDGGETGTRLISRLDLAGIGADGESHRVVADTNRS